MRYVAKRFVAFCCVSLRCLRGNSSECKPLEVINKRERTMEVNLARETKEREGERRERNNEQNSNHFNWLHSCSVLLIVVVVVVAVVVAAACAVASSSSSLLLHFSSLARRAFPFRL